MEYSASDYPNNRSFVYSRKLKDTTVVSENVSKIYEINEKKSQKRRGSI